MKQREGLMGKRLTNALFDGAFLPSEYDCYVYPCLDSKED